MPKPPPLPPLPPTPPAPPAATPPAAPAPPPPPSTTFEPLTPERRREMTRRHLLDAAAVVFARRGFHGATLDEIASYAGFTKGAVYSNFKNKDDLFVALLDHRTERQFAITAEVLEAGPHERAEQLPRVRELLHAGAFFWDDDFAMLYLEFVLYAQRNAEARAKLAESARHERELIRELIEREYDSSGDDPPYSTIELAEIARAMFTGLHVSRLVDPAAVNDETIDTTLAMLYASLGIEPE